MLTIMVFNKFLLLYRTKSLSPFIFHYENSLATVYGTPFESLKSVEFPIHTLVPNSNSKDFHSNTPSFQITL